MTKGLARCEQRMVSEGVDFSVVSRKMHSGNCAPPNGLQTCEACDDSTTVVLTTNVMRKPKWVLKIAGE
jgi:hypothetical protein